MKETRPAEGDSPIKIEKSAEGADFGGKVVVTLPKSEVLYFVADKADVQGVSLSPDGKVDYIKGSFSVYPGALGNSDTPEAAPIEGMTGIEFKIQNPQSLITTDANALNALKALSSNLVTKGQDAAKSFKPSEDDEGIKQEFFNPGNNAIRRSFESTRGTGLAGFITSLSLSYDEAVWSTDAKVGRGPKEVSITMAFAPVHDLPVGLDYTGRLRSMSHPVAINHAKSDAPGHFATTYDGMDDAGGKGHVPKMIDILEKSYRNVKYESAAEGIEALPTNDPNGGTALA